MRDIPAAGAAGTDDGVAGQGRDTGRWSGRCANGARSDETVAAAVASADRRLLRAVRQAFCDYGFDADEAELRANTTFAAGVGLLHLSGPNAKETIAAAARAVSLLHAAVVSGPY